MRMLKIVLILFSCGFLVFSKRIPSYIKLCHRDDPQIEQCFKNAIEVLRPHFLTGIPDLFIPSMNPLIVLQAGINSGDSFKANFKNIQVYHADEFKLRDLKVDLPNNQVKLSIGFPRLRIKSQYSVDGRILIFQLQGSGPADGNFTDVTGIIALDGSRYIKNGKEFIKFDQGKVNLNLGKPVFLFQDLFRDNRELTDQTNKVLNENIVEIIEELKPVIEETVLEITTGIVKNLFDRYSFDELFPK